MSPSKVTLSVTGSGPHLIHGSLDPYDMIESPLKRHLDRLRRFCTPHPCAPTHTDTQTTLRATSVAIGRIYALAIRPKKGVAHILQQLTDMTHMLQGDLRSLTLTLRRSPLPDVDDCRSTLLLPTSERFSELGIATTNGDHRSVPQIQIRVHRHSGPPRRREQIDDERYGGRTRALNRITSSSAAAEVYSTVRR